MIDRTEHPYGAQRQAQRAAARRAEAMGEAQHIASMATRARYAYIGAPRVRHDGRHFDQMHFAPPAEAVRWTKYEQADAIDRGYFLERCMTGAPRDIGSANHVIVLPLSHGPYKTDQDVMDALEHAGFQREVHALHALTFIEQQDKYGYSYVWDKVCETYRSSLMWYKRLRSDPEPFSRIAQRVAQRSMPDGVARDGTARGRPKSPETIIREAFLATPEGRLWQIDQDRLAQAKRATAARTTPTRASKPLTKAQIRKRYEDIINDAVERGEPQLIIDDLLAEAKAALA